MMQTLRKILFCYISIGAFLIASVSAQEAQHVILMETMPVPAVLEHSRWFQESLQELGIQEGMQIELTLLEANGDRQLAEELLSSELSKGTPDLVVTIATLATQTAVNLLQGTEVPILFFQVSDPVGVGIVEHINVPTGTNVTGKVYTVAREAKIEMILRLVKQHITHMPIRFGFIHSTYPSSQGDIRELQSITKKRDDVVFIPYEIPYQEVPAGLPTMLKDVERAVAELKEQVDFWIEPLGPLGESIEYTQILLEQSTIPIAFGTKLQSVKMGALMHITPNLKAGGYEAAELAMQILNGLDPGQIPVTPPSSFDVGINVTTALQLKIVIPPDVLQLAGEHVYR